MDLLLRVVTGKEKEKIVFNYSFLYN